MIWHTFKQHSSTFNFWFPLWGHFQAPYFKMLNDAILLNNIQTLLIFDSLYGVIFKHHILKCSMMPELHQLVPMSGHVTELETAKKLQLYATSRCTSVSTGLKTRPGYCFLWVLWVMISKFTENFGIISSKMALQSSYNFDPIEITWRKIVCSVCLKPVSMATWHLHTLWLFTVPAYNVETFDKSSFAFKKFKKYSLPHIHTSPWFYIIRTAETICDAIWENPPHVAHGNFAEIQKNNLKIVMFSLFYINFDNT